jgi:hypothetical protein
LWHIEIEGQPPAEVAPLFGLTRNAVSALAGRAREGLREAYLQVHLAQTTTGRCRATADRLGAWTRGGLSRRETAQVETHLDQCPRCRALAAELADVNGGLRAVAIMVLGVGAAGYLAGTAKAAAGTAVGGASGGAVAVGLPSHQVAGVGVSVAALAVAVAFVVIGSGSQSIPVAVPPAPAATTRPADPGVADPAPLSGKLAGPESRGSAVSPSIVPPGSSGPAVGVPGLPAPVRPIGCAQQASGCAPPPPCPNGTRPHFRWQYSASGSAGSWSGTQPTSCPGSVSMGPQAMEGDLRVAPGATLIVGYDFTMPGNKANLTLTVTSPRVVFAVHCVSGAAPTATTFTVALPTQSYSVVAGQASGNPHNALAYQGSSTVPDLCGGGNLRLDQGGTFTATLR